MTAPRLIRLVPTGEVFMGTELVEPEEVRPLTEEQVRELIAQKTCHGLADAIAFARAIEQAHGIGRRLDA